MNQTGRSIFVKLVLIFGAMTALTLAWIGGFLHFASKGNLAPPVWRRNLARYAKYVVDDVGLPPNMDRARELGAELNFELRIESKDREWTTSPQSPKIAELETHVRRTREDFRMGRIGRRAFFLFDAEKARYAFLFRREPFWEGQWELILLLLGGVGIIVGMGHAIVRRTLSPLNQIREGVLAIGGGNLAHEIPVRGRDELAGLASSFNDMSRRVREILRSKEQLIADVSHELRSPLTRAKLALEFLPPGTPKEQMRSELAELERMTGDILEVARLGSPYSAMNLRSVEPRRLLDSLFSNNKQVTIREIPTSPAKIDVEKFGQALRNLVENALHHGGGNAEIIGVVEGNFLQLEIRDRGPGIAKEDLEMVLEPFYRTDKSRNHDTGGFGLGLAIAKRILVAHGGDISLSPRSGGGLIVIVRVPLAAQPTVVGAPGKPSASSM